MLLSSSKKRGPLGNTTAKSAKVPICRSCSQDLLWAAAVRRVRPARRAQAGPARVMFVRQGLVPTACDTDVWPEPSSLAGSFGSVCSSVLSFVSGWTLLSNSPRICLLVVVLPGEDAIRSTASHHQQISILNWSQGSNRLKDHPVRPGKNQNHRVPARGSCRTLLWRCPWASAVSLAPPCVLRAGLPLWARRRSGA